MRLGAVGLLVPFVACGGIATSDRDKSEDTAKSDAEESSEAKNEEPTVVLRPASCLDGFWVDAAGVCQEVSSCWPGWEVDEEASATSDQTCRELPPWFAGFDDLEGGRQAELVVGDDGQAFHIVTNRTEKERLVVSEVGVDDGAVVRRADIPWPSWHVSSVDLSETTLRVLGTHGSGGAERRNYLVRIDAQTQNSNAEFREFEFSGVAREVINDEAGRAYLLGSLGEELLGQHPTGNGDGLILRLGDDDVPVSAQLVGNGGSVSLRDGYFDADGRLIVVGDTMISEFEQSPKEMLGDSDADPFVARSTDEEGVFEIMQFGTSALERVNEVIPIDSSRVAIHHEVIHEDAAGSAISIVNIDTGEVRQFPVSLNQDRYLGLLSFRESSLIIVGTTRIPHSGFVQSGGWDTYVQALDTNTLQTATHQFDTPGLRAHFVRSNGELVFIRDQSHLVLFDLETFREVEDLDLSAFGKIEDAIGLPGGAVLLAGRRITRAGNGWDVGDHWVAKLTSDLQVPDVAW